MTDPAPGNLLVHVRAAGVNRADVYARGRSSGPIIGGELAGEVVAVGEPATGWAVGDRVMSLGNGFAPEAVVPAAHAMPVPPFFSWEEAGALPVALLTMHDALITQGGLGPGGRVLVHAATSGVGVTGVQLAALLGASVVYATSRSSEKLEVLLSFVGDVAPCELVGIDTSSTAFESMANDVDVIIDNIGASVLTGNLAAVRVTGRIVQVGRLGGKNAEIDLDELARKRVGLLGVTFRTRNADDVTELVRRAMADVAKHLSRLRPRVERAYPLRDLDVAIADLAANRHVGKLVVVP